RRHLIANRVLARRALRRGTCLRPMARIEQFRECGFPPGAPCAHARGQPPGTRCTAPRSIQPSVRREHMRRTVNDWGRVASVAAASCLLWWAWKYRARRRDDTRRALGGSHGVFLRERVTVRAPADRLFAFWKN